MNYFINKLLQNMLDEDIIEVEEAELYQYGLYLIFLKFLHFFSILFFGFLLGKIFEILSFTSCYSLLRSYTGGYHAKHPLTCLSISILMVLVIVWTSDVIFDKALIVIACLSTIIICRLSPSVSEKKPLEYYEIEKNRRISIIIAITIFITFILFYIINIKEFYVGVSHSLFFCSLFLVI